MLRYQHRKQTKWVIKCMLRDRMQESTTASLSLSRSFGWIIESFQLGKSFIYKEIPTEYFDDIQQNFRTQLFSFLSTNILLKVLSNQRIIIMIHSFVVESMSSVHLWISGASSVEKSTLAKVISTPRVCWNLFISSPWFLVVFSIWYRSFVSDRLNSEDVGRSCALKFIVVKITDHVSSLHAIGFGNVSPKVTRRQISWLKM